ncbi:MAG: DNA gyrase inhibitor YacG [Pseudomonadales bacterium]
MSCPQCGQQSKRNSYPFCSKRCTELDLGAWLNGRYALALEEQDLRLPKE